MDCSDTDESESVSDAEEQEIIIANPVNKKLKTIGNSNSRHETPKPSLNKRQKRHLEKKKEKQRAYLAAKKQQKQAAGGEFFVVADFAIECRMVANSTFSFHM